MVRAGISRSPVSNKQKDGKKDIYKSGLVILILVVGMIGYYYYLSNRAAAGNEENLNLTVAQELINRNLSYTYPPSPKEVVKFYSDITKCFYNEEYSNTELEQLAEQTYKLYDDRLAANNDWNTYLIELTKQINEYKEKNIRISSYFIPSSDDVEYFTYNDEKYAKLYCSYVLQSGSSKRTVDEVFILHKDADGHWKILGCDRAENADTGE